LRWAVTHSFTENAAAPRVAAALRPGPIFGGRYTISTDRFIPVSGYRVATALVWALSDQMGCRPNRKLPLGGRCGVQAPPKQVMQG
jgi:hypothetical protein